MRTWSNPDPRYDGVWYAWFMFRSALRESGPQAKFWLDEFFRRRAEARLARQYGAKPPHQPPEGAW